MREAPHRRPDDGRRPRLTTASDTTTLWQQGSWEDGQLEATRFAALRSGLLEFLILAIVSTGDVYAADILDRLAATDFATREGTLYPLLSRLRREGLLDYDWRESPAGPPRKYYRLTPLGQAHLAEFRGYWAALSTLIDDLGR